MTKLFFKTGAIMMVAVCMMLTSCQDDLTTDQSILNYETEFAAAESAFTNSCFELVYPVTIELSDGSQLSVADQTEMRTAAKNDIETNGREVGKPDLIYPVEVIVDGETQSIADQESLAAIVAECGGNSRGRSGNNRRGGKGSSCFELSYPLTFAYTDGTMITVESREERKEAFTAYNEANPDVDERPELQFPVTVTLADDTEQVLATQEDFDSLKESCGGNSGRSNGRRGNGSKASKCFSLVYPVNYSFEDGSMTTVNSREEKKEAFTAYREANPDAEDKPQLEYPISILFEDGTTLSIASEEELDTAKDTCADDDADDSDAG